MFEAMTYDVLIQRMLDRIPDDMDKREGSVIWDALSPAALELEFLYMCLDYTLNQSFADTQEREYLIRRAEERGIYPKAATKAVLRGDFTPTELDVTGRRFSLGTNDYVALEPMEGTAGAYRMQCETAGTAGNQRFGTLIPIDYVDGLETASLTALLVPGEDEQSTESLREAYFASFTDIDYGGNIAGYTKMALDVPGVGAAKVTPAWQGGGTIEITILDAEFNAASSTLIDNVQQAIDPKQDGCGEGLAFIDHIVTVDTPAQIQVQVAASIDFEAGYSWEDMQGEITAAVEAYLASLRRSWADTDGIVLRIARVESAILALEGVIDVTDTRLNGTAGNLSLPSMAIPVLEVVTNG